MEIGLRLILNIYLKRQKFSLKRAYSVRSRAIYKPRFGLYNSRFGLYNSRFGLYKPNLELKNFFVVMKFPTFVVDFATLSGDNAARERKSCKPEKNPRATSVWFGDNCAASDRLKDLCLTAKIKPLQQERQRIQRFQELLRWREPCRNLCSRLWREGCTTARVCGCRSGGRGRDPRRGGQYCP